MVAILVLLMVIIGVSIDILLQKRHKKIKETEQDFYFHPIVGITMADGGKKIEKDKSND